MEFPKFNGENPLGWIRQAEKYFEMPEVPDECRIDMAQMYVSGRADIWLRSSGILINPPPWPQFCKLICNRFADCSIYDVMDNFHSLKQNYTQVSSYIDKFEENMTVVRKEHPYLEEQYYVVSFVNGLKDEIKCHLRALRPNSLTDAYWLAKDYEKGLQYKKNSKFSGFGHSKPNQYQQGKVQMKQEPREANQYRNIQTTNKVRKPRECWRCFEKWTPQHKCKQAPMVNAMITEQQEEENRIQPEQDKGSDDEQLEVSKEVEEEQLMQISEQTVKGITDSSTLSLVITIGGKRGVVLLDSGSTNTFIDYKFAIKTNCKIINNEMTQVTIAGGGKLHT